MKEFFIGIIFLGLIVILFFGLIKLSEYNSVEPIRSLSYESNEELKPYIDKFFRDLDNNNVPYIIPQNFIVKFSDLESYKNTSHIHGMSLGHKDDDRVEIYINKRSWNSFNKTQRYYIVYHELSHDILNLDDLSESDNNYGKIMYPYISKYDGLKMNDFIKNMKLLFDSK